MNIHLSFALEDGEFVLFLAQLLHKQGHTLSGTDYTDGPNALQKRRVDTQQKIEQADLVIGAASPNLFMDQGDELRRDWNALLINRRPSFMIVHEQPLLNLSHAYISVRRMMLDRYDPELPLRPGSPHDRFLKLVSDPELVGDFERFTYTDPLWPADKPGLTT